MFLLVETLHWHYEKKREFHSGNLELATGKSPLPADKNVAATSALPPSLAVNGDGTAGADFAVQFHGVVQHLHVEGFFLPVQFEIVWYSP